MTIKAASPDELQAKRDQAILECIKIILEHRRKRLAREAKERAHEEK